MAILLYGIVTRRWFPPGEVRPCRYPQFVRSFTSAVKPLNKNEKKLPGHQSFKINHKKVGLTCNKNASHYDFAWRFKTFFFLQKKISLSSCGEELKFPRRNSARDGNMQKKGPGGPGTYNAHVRFLIQRETSPEISHR